MRIRFHKIFFYIYAALIFFAPLIMFHKTSEIFEFNKILFIYLITFIVLALWSARMIVRKKIIIQKSILALPLLLFVVSQGVSTLFSIDQHTSIFGYYSRFNGGFLSILAYVLLSFAFLSNINIKGKIFTYIDKLLKISMLGSLVVMLWGLPSKFGYDLTCLVFTGNFDVSCWTNQFQPTVRVFSTLGQPNWLGAYLSTHVFIGLYYYFKEQAQKVQWMYLGYIFLTTLMLFYTQSRSAMAGVAMGMILVGIYFIVQKRDLLVKKQRFSTFLPILAMVFALLIAGTGVVQVDNVLRLRFLTQNEAATEEPTSSELESGQVNDDILNITPSSDIRRIVWQGGFNVGKTHPLFGTGVETFAYSYNFERPRDHNVTSEWNYIYNKAHNEFVNYFATTGILGLGTYILFIAIVLMHIKHVLVHKNDPQGKYLLAMFLLAAFVALNVSNFFGFSTTVAQLYFYLIPAIIVLLLYNSETGESTAKITLSKKQKYLMTMPAVTLLIGIFFVLQYFLADVAYARGDSLRRIQEYAQSQQHLYNAYNIRQEHVYADKIAQVNGQIVFVSAIGTAETTDESKLPICVSHSGERASCIELARRYGAEAIEGSPSNPLYYRTHARNHLIFYQVTGEQGYFDEAIAILQQARKIAPTDPRYPYQHALFYFVRHEGLQIPSEKDNQLLRAQAIGALDFALELKPNYRDAYYLKGLILQTLGDKEAAKSAYEYILNNIDPQDGVVKEELESL